MANTIYPYGIISLSKINNKSYKEAEKKFFNNVDLLTNQYIDEMNKNDYLGFHDWRIPEKEEIEKLFSPESTIMARSNCEIHLDPLFAPGGGNASWCLPYDQQAAFYFSYVSGNSQQFDQDYSQGYVRLVRLYPDD